MVSTTGLFPSPLRAEAGVEFYETVSTFPSANGPAVVDRLGSSEMQPGRRGDRSPDEELIRFIRTAIMQIHRGLRRFFQAKVDRPLRRRMLKGMCGEAASNLNIEQGTARSTCRSKASREMPHLSVLSV